VARYILGSLPDGYSPTDPIPEALADKWVLAKLNRAVADISKSLDDYRFAEGLEQVYSLLWDDFADWYLEASKVSPNPSVLAHGLETILKLAHPFAPFVTEAIWQKMAWHKQDLIVTSWPQSVEDKHLNSDFVRFESVKSAVLVLRKFVSDIGLKEPQVVVGEEFLDQSSKAVFEFLTRSKLADGGVESLKEYTKLPGFPVWLKVTNSDLDSVIKKQKESLKKLSDYRNKLTHKLENKAYRKNAPSIFVMMDEQHLDATNQSITELELIVEFFTRELDKRKP
jgi:valyl-tRNA synthetase